MRSLTRRERIAFPELSSAEKIAFYSLLKTYVSHEDVIVSNRVLWLISFNAVLIPSYAAMAALFFFLIQNSIAVLYLSWLMILAVVVSILCMMVAVSCLLSIRHSANKARTAVERWQRVRKFYSREFPSVGSYNRKGKQKGNFFASTIAGVFAVIWLFVLSVTIYLWRAHLPQIEANALARMAAAQISDMENVRVDFLNA